MEEGYQLKLKCGGDGCDKILRINVTPVHFGRIVVVTCPCCRTKMSTKIPEQLINGQPTQPQSQTSRDRELAALQMMFAEMLGKMPNE